MGLVEAWAAGGWGEEKYPRTGLEAWRLTADHDDDHAERSRDRGLLRTPWWTPTPLEGDGGEGRGGDGCLASIKMRDRSAGNMIAGSEKRLDKLQIEDKRRNGVESKKSSTVDWGGFSLENATEEIGGGEGLISP
jgi:hypothetical protein